MISYSIVNNIMIAKTKVHSQAEYLILAVDDDEQIRELLSTIISRLGHRCVTAVDGLDALQKLKEYTFDLVITDINMPLMCGIELIKRIVSDFKGVDVIGISGHLDRYRYADIVAIGTIIKAVAGQFPAYFAFLVGAPDLLFGLSALILGWQASVRNLSQRFLIAWNLIGVAVILPAAPLIQLGLPGPIQIFTSEPTAEKLFDFPMVLAPSIIVPTLVLLNLVTAWRLVETGSTKA
jgi:CheY-like chemotaxis protein